MSTPFSLIGHDNPYGRYPAPVVPIGSCDGRLVVAWNAGEAQFDGLEAGAEFVRHDEELIQALASFDPHSERLFAFSATDLVSYLICDEGAFYRQLLDRNLLSGHFQYLRFDLAKSSKDLAVLKAEFKRTLLYVLREAPGLVESWYGVQRIDLERLSLPLPDDWHEFLALKSEEIGHNLTVVGEMIGEQDLVVDGELSGTIKLPHHILTIGSHGRVKAHVFAKAVVVLGNITGNIVATEKVDIRDGGAVDGDITAPRVSISERAHFRGAVYMTRRPKKGVMETVDPELAGVSAQSRPESVSALRRNAPVQGVGLASRNE
jgi:cytoskeletal protein CcmA (bactofilin family)